MPLNVSEPGSPQTMSPQTPSPKCSAQTTPCLPNPSQCPMEYVLVDMNLFVSRASRISFNGVGIIPITSTSTLDDLKAHVEALFDDNRFDIATQARAVQRGQTTQTVITTPAVVITHRAEAPQTLLSAQHTGPAVLEDFKMWIHFDEGGGDSGFSALELLDSERDLPRVYALLKQRGWRDCLVVDGYLTFKDEMVGEKLSG